MSSTPHNAWVVDASASDFEQEVMIRSRDVPVVVDFWAPWCGPCRALGPVLEKLAATYEGQFVLVKANVDEIPEAASRFNVSGIPAVFAVYNEQVFDFFSGALPESAVRAWLDRVLSATRLQLARRLEKESPTKAEAVYRELLAQDPKNMDVKIGLARVLLTLNQLDECRALIKEVEDHGFLDAEVQKIKAQLELHGKRHDDLPERRAAAQANPQDLELQFQFAEALAGAQQYEEALEILLSLVQRDKKVFGPRARELMVQIFQALPPDSEVSNTFRRKLSMALY